MADIGLVLAHSQENETNTGLNLLTLDLSLQSNCHMADRGLVVAHTQTTGTNVSLNLLTADPSLKKDVT